MPAQTISEISELAEFLGEEYLKTKGVDLYGIMDARNITYSFNNYGKSFEGLLEYKYGEFHIFLNKELLKTKNGTRTRFTAAHEIGHYSIDAHRIQLENGKSLSFNGKVLTPAQLKMEREANTFASNLLMPKSSFLKIISANSLGIQAIFSAQKRFSTSLEATAIQYMQLDVSPSVLIRWDSAFSVKKILVTKSFMAKTGIYKVPQIIINHKHLNDIKDLLSQPKSTHYEGATSLSSWIATIPKGGKHDVFAVEQTRTMGPYGAFTLLTIEF
ncbi:MAG: ImmA/IrrE family metallo-endopeptidase [Flavisolibacter sp.]